MSYMVPRYSANTIEWDTMQCKHRILVDYILTSQSPLHLFTTQADKQIARLVDIHDKEATRLRKENCVLKEENAALKAQALAYTKM